MLKLQAKTQPVAVMLKPQAQTQPAAVMLKLWERAKTQPVAVIPQLVMMTLTLQPLQPVPLIRILNTFRFRSSIQ